MRYLPTKLLRLILFCFYAFDTVTNAQTVSNVRADQEGNDILIYYDLSADSPCNVELYCSKDGGNGWLGPLESVAGDIGKQVKLGKKMCRWSVLRDMDELKGVSIRFKVMATPMERVLNYISIGNQIWSQANLNVNQFSNGEPIPEAHTEYEWASLCALGKPACSDYMYDSNVGASFGKLYNWYAVADPRGLCPAGWHVPSDQQWQIMSEYLGGSNQSGGKVKSQTGWSFNGNGSNESGFNGLPAGLQSPDGKSDAKEEYAYWWSSTGFSTSEAWAYGLYYSNGYLLRSTNLKGNGFSIRCVSDKVK